VVKIQLQSTSMAQVFPVKFTISVNSLKKKVGMLFVLRYRKESF